jgi:hypothetical protein
MQMLLDDNCHANAGVNRLQGGALEAAGPACSPTGSNRNSADCAGTAGAKSSGDRQAHILWGKTSVISWLYIAIVLGLLLLRMCTRTLTCILLLMY